MINVTELLLTVIVAVTFCIWLGLTILLHVPLSVLDGLRIRDKLAITPSWRFFAPIPGTSDYHLLARDKFVGGTVGAWQEADINSKQRTALAFLWNPDKRSNKALFDVTTTLLQVASKANDQHETIPLSIPYLILLNAVSNLPRSPFTTGRQFMLVKTDGPGALPDLLFISNMHDL